MAVNTLISVSDAAKLNNAVFVDCRFNLGDPGAGASQYADNHIQSARFADLEKDLSGEIVPGKTGRHPLPEKTALTKTIQKFGISNEHSVIAYDANNGAFASRLWWLLRDLGHEAVWVLDGGFDAWITASMATSSETKPFERSDFEAGPSLCNKILAVDIPASPLSLYDARDEARYRGEQEPIDPVAGHIPGALCLPFTHNLNENGSFHSVEDLRARFLEAGVPSDRSIACYCGSGVTACHNILALRHAGFPEPYLYAGSWSEWITDPTRPVATGNE